MKVLFICSGNSKTFDIVPFIKAQGDSLEKKGVKVDYFLIREKGLIGYIKGGLKLRKFLKIYNFDIVHAHFTLSGWSSVLGAGRTPVILSLMGTDAQGDYIGYNKIRFSSRIYMVLTFLIQPFVKAIISKSQSIENYVYLKQKSYIIPNGINTKIFKPHLEGFRKELNLKENIKYILFLGSKEKTVKNYALAQEAVNLLNMSNVELINPYPVLHSEIPKYLNSVNVMVLPSYMEGSPNVIKEAMACNCPVVSTDVGDVRWILGETRGCYITTFEVQDFADKLQLALEYSISHGRTTGLKRILELSLSSEETAMKLIDVYKKYMSSTLSYNKFEHENALTN